MNDIADWSANLRSARRRRGLTQADLAEAAGISPQLISLIEGGYLSSTRTREAISAALSCPPAELFPVA